MVKYGVPGGGREGAQEVKFGAQQVEFWCPEVPRR